MTSPTHYQIAAYLTYYAISELIKSVMEDTGCTLRQAMDGVYTSPVMVAQQEEDNELYV